MSNVTFLSGWRPSRPAPRPDYSGTQRQAAARQLFGLRNSLRLLATPGDRFGKLTVLSVQDRHRHCRCDCGKARRVHIRELMYGSVTACKWCSQLRRLAKAGHKVRSRPTPEGKETAKEKVQRLREDGVSLRQISARTGLNYGFVWRATQAIQSR